MMALEFERCRIGSESNLRTRVTTCQMSSSERRVSQAGIAVFRIPCFTIQNISLSVYDVRPVGKCGAGG